MNAGIVFLNINLAPRRKFDRFAAAELCPCNSAALNRPVGLVTRLEMFVMMFPLSVKTYYPIPLIRH